MHLPGLVNVGACINGHVGIPRVQAVTIHSAGNCR